MIQLAAAEKKKTVFKCIQIKVLLDDGYQTVNRLSHISIACGEIETFCPGDSA